jgi:2,4-dienoyl-CoA reductase-like NADH-dependent reductase (Old Yellow Enzyme family)/thioredoxin reductase
MNETWPGHARYPDVFTPITLNSLTIRNRIFVPAHTTNFGENHLPSQRHVDYHRERAMGGVGAVIFEAIRVMDNTLGRPQGVSGYMPGTVEAFAAVARAVQEQGAAMIAQICHMGRQIEGEFERTVSVSASDLRWSPTATHPRALDRHEMDAVRDAHVAVARNMVLAGMDGIELHWGHGHLLQQFLSPLSNRRTDAYGGSTANRMRFPLEVLQAVRDAVGPGYCLGIRVSADEFIDGGLTLAMSEEIAVLAARACQIDFIHVSHSAYHMSHSLGTQMADMAFGVEEFRALPRGIRRALREAGLDTPVLTVCKYREFQDAQDMLAAGSADMVGMARAHVADPAIVRKHALGRESEVRRCVGCNQGCAQRLERNIAITCLINPRAGLEGRWPEADQDPAPVSRKVLVVGGGPAGCEAAWVAAARGHRVSLWERSDRLGGQLNWTRSMPLRADFQHLLDHQQRMLERHGVQVLFGREATAQQVRDGGFDEVVVATGSEALPLDLPTGQSMLTMEQALAEPDRLGHTVAFCDTTGEWSALSVVEHLADLGKKVTVFTPVAGFAWRTTIYSTLSNRKRLREKGVRLALLRSVKGFDGGVLQVEDTSTGEILHETGFDSLVGAQYGVPRSGLESELKALAGPGGAAPRWHLAGDCISARTAVEAVYEGHALGRSL